MSTWKVIKTKIEIYDHPNAERLALGKIGNYQVVVQRDLYKGGEEVLFAPEKSLLTGVLEQEYKAYLGGPGKNRVCAIRLRDELSCGIIIPPELVFQQCGKTIDELPNDVDLSEYLGITKYVPVVPEEMLGSAVPIEHDVFSTKHDVEQFGVYAANFIENERVVLSEKLHGSQVNIYAGMDKTGVINQWISTKNYNAEGLMLLETPDSFYWKCVNNPAVIIFPRIYYGFGDNTRTDEWVVQVFAEAIPYKGHFNYGQDEPTLRIFDVRVNGESIPYDQVPQELRELWVPILYDGPYDMEKIRPLVKGMEQVSGKGVNIKEGGVLRPYIDRRAKDGTRLMVKLLNPKYRETGEESS